MNPITNREEERCLEEKTENLIAIGAATASNCIPCFEYLYEKAITSGLTSAEIKRATDIAGKVKKGAHIALSSSVDELMGPNDNEDAYDLPCDQAAPKSCCG